MIRPREPGESRLPFPTRPLKIGDETIEEYIIPEDRKQELLAHLYPFVPVPSLDDELFDLHEGKTFRVRDYRVTREKGCNWLVSPYYPSSGGTVIDWVPADLAEESEGDEDPDPEAPS
jgi:hypothetical protein